MIPGQDSLLEMEPVLVKVGPLQVYYGRIGTMGGGKHCKVLLAIPAIIFFLELLLISMSRNKSVITCICPPVIVSISHCLSLTHDVIFSLCDR